MLTGPELESALAALGELLADRGYSFDLAIIGGGALSIARFVDRSTKDLDIVALVDAGVLKSAAPLPGPLAEAIADIATYKQLSTDWLNNGPTSMLRFGLPDGFLERCERRTYHTLCVRLASRLDQIHFKLYAAVDDRPGGKHHKDLEALAPTPSELQAAALWSRSHDPSEGFATMVEQVLVSFEKGKR